MGLVIAFMNMMSWTSMTALQPATLLTCLRNPQVSDHFTFRAANTDSRNVASIGTQIATL